MENHNRSRPILVLVHQLATLLLFLPTLTLSAAIKTDLITESSPYHVAWRENNQKRFDFLFTLNEPLRNDDRVDSVAQSALSNCVGYHACLLQDGKVIQKHQIDQRLGNQTIFSSGKEGPSNSPNTKPEDIVVIHHYCSTHWNPLVHNARSGGNHTFSWFSPISCPLHTTNYERPCYVYDSLGNLINLTPWILSNSFSHQVNVGSFNKSIKQFRMNVCNDAHDTCGPNVSSCYEGSNGRVESGYNNLTTISYNETEKVATLTSLGQFNSSCPNQRLQTVVKFICLNKILEQTRPKLVKANACENVVEWKTIHACPEPDIRKRAVDCTMKNDAWGIDIDLRHVTNNATSVLVPNVLINNTRHSMVLGLCRGLNPNIVKCEGKSNSQTNACLLKPETKSQEANVTNSNSVGLISESYIRFTDDQIYLESYAANKSCQVSMGHFNATKQLGTRIEFFCSRKNQSAPTFLDFVDCTYVFRWGSPLLCPENLNETELSAFKKYIEPLATNSSSHQRSKQSEENERAESKTAHEMHIESLDDAKKMLEPQHDQKIVDDQMEKPSKAPIDSSSSSANTAPTSKSTSTPQNTNVTPSSAENKTVEIAKVLGHQTSIIEPHQTSPRMNAFHKFFMSGLILMVLTAFIVIIFILDKKTRLRIPLGSIRRQARQVFQPNQAPYTRINRFNDSLDL